MRKIIAALIAAALCVSFAVPASAEEEEEFEGYIVSLDESELLRGLSADSESVLRELGGGLYHASQLGDVTELVRMGLVEYIEPNYKMYLQDYEPLWNMEAVKAASTWAHTDSSGEHDLRGDGVIVAVIDSGVYAGHPDLAGANILDYIDLTGNDSAVDTTHGTQVAGILAAQLDNDIGIDGAVPGVSILPIRITSGGETTNALAIEAINLAVEMGADIINISIGGKKANSGLQQACADAAEAGVIIVSAAGNYVGGTKSESDYMYPASFEGIISVSACMESGGDIMFDESYSYFNSMVDASAPGTGVVSLSIDGGTKTGKGTSFAAPHITALAVMAKQHSESADHDVFMALLESSCADMGTAGRDNKYGLGFADFEAFGALVAEKQNVVFISDGEDAEFAEGEGMDGYYFSSRPTTLPEPVREGYSFLAWYDNANLSGEAVEAIPANSFGEKCFYAAWEEAPVEEPVEPPADEPVEPPADEPVEPPADEPVEPPADEPAEPPADEPVEPPADEPADPPADEPVDPPADEPADPPVDDPAGEPGSISAETLRAAAESGEGVSLELENAELWLSPEAVEQLAACAAENIEASLERTDSGYELIFYAEGEELELSAPVRVSMTEGSGIVYYAKAGEEARAVSVSSPVNGRLRFIIPGGGQVQLRQTYSYFADLNGHWAAVSATFVANRGIFQGDGTNFMPGGDMTRAMFATVLGRIYERSYGTLETEGGGYFSDCDYSSWYGPYVDWCYEAGIVQGDGKGNFDPNASINRAQMAAMIFRFANYLGLETASDSEGEFSDSTDIPAWAAQAVDFCLDSGIMGGVGEGRFAPMDKATRAQCAAVLQRLIVYALR